MHCGRKAGGPRPLAEPRLLEKIQVPVAVLQSRECCRSRGNNDRFPLNTRFTRSMDVRIHASIVRHDTLGTLPDYPGPPSHLYTWILPRENSLESSTSLAQQSRNLCEFLRAIVFIQVGLTTPQIAIYAACVGMPVLAAPAPGPMGSRLSTRRNGWVRRALVLPISENSPSMMRRSRGLSPSSDLAPPHHLLGEVRMIEFSKAHSRSRWLPMPTWAIGCVIYSTLKNERRTNAKSPQLVSF